MTARSSPPSGSRSRPTAAERSGPASEVAPDFDHAAAAFAGGFFLGDYQGLGVSGTTFTPFFGATLETQANGQVGSDIFAATAD